VRQAAFIASIALLVAAEVRAQAPLENPPTSAAFMSRYDFHLSAAALGTDDARFSWDTHWGGDFDFIDYVNGRLSFFADYQAMLGEEFRPFDPIQGNYTLAVSGSVRLGPTELAGVLHHVSRHLSDRPKPESIAWNALLARVLRQVTFDGGSLSLRAEGGPVVERAFIDYTWLASAEIVGRQSFGPVISAYGRALGEAYKVDPDVAGRERQLGGRLEGGVRFSGPGGAMDLFAGYERVVDAYQFDRRARRWFFAGFRLVN
jgi:hypothetical protein